MLNLAFRGEVSTSRWSNKVGVRVWGHLEVRDASRYEQ